MKKATRDRRRPGYEKLIAARGALVASVAIAPMVASAETCTPPPPAPTSAPLAITCQDDATPVQPFITYTTGPHEITIVNGDFNNIATGAGDDVVIVQGGSAATIQTGSQGDRITVDGGVIGQLLGEAGGDVITLNNGAVGVVFGGDDTDTIQLNGGRVRSVFAEAGNDSVRLDGSVRVDTQINGGAGDDSLTLTGAGTLDGSFREFEVLVIGSNAQWTFRESNSNFSSFLLLEQNAALEVEAGRTLRVGDVAVDQGATLIVDGTLDYEPNIFGFTLDGTLAGSGEVALAAGPGIGLSVSPSGVIRPGSGGIGTLTVSTSDIQILRPGAQLIAEVDPAAAQTADLLVVNGNVIGTDNLSIVVEPTNPVADAASYTAAGNFVVLQANTIDGDAPTIIEGANLPALVDVSIVGSPSASGEVALAFTEQPIAALPQQPAVTATGNPNHANVAGGIAATAAANPSTPLVSGGTVGGAAPTLTNGQAGALNNVHAEPFSSYQTVLLEDYGMVAGIVLGHAGRSAVSFGGFSTPERGLAGSADVARGPFGAGSSDGWASLAYVDGSVDGQSGLGSFDYSVGGLVLGTDLYDAAGLRAGIYGAINRARLSEHDGVDQEIDGQSYHLGAYASWEAGNDFFVSGVTGVAFGSHDSERLVPSVGAFTGGTATTSFDTRGLYLGAQIERSFDVSGAFTLTPSASAVYARTIQKASSETGGGDFNFAMDDSQADSLATSLGITARRSMDTSGQEWTLVGSAHYTRDWLAGDDSLHEITVSNPVFGSFTQVGQNRGANSLTAGLGVSGRLSTAIEVGAGYAYSWNENGDEHGLSASLSVTW